MKKTSRPSSLLSLSMAALSLFTLLLLASCERYSFNSYENGEFAWALGPRRVMVKALGTIEFAPDDSDVVKLSPDGYLMIEETMAWDSRILEFSSGANGAVSRKLTLDGKEQPLDAETRALIARLLPEVIRHTGLDAETRVKRLLSSGGYRAFADEMERLGRDSVRSRYVEEALKQNTLSETEQADLLRHAGYWVNRDSRRADLLRGFIPRLESESFRDPFFDALDSIGSGSNRANLLREVLTKNAADGAIVSRALESASRIGSDSNRANLLRDAVVSLGNPAVRESFFNAAGTIGSDSNKAHVLLAALERPDPDAELLVAVLRTVPRMGSDSNKGAVLERAAPYAAKSPEVREAFFDAAETIGSNSNRTNALAAVYDHRQVDAVTLARLYRAGSTMGSDSNKADLLLHSLDTYHEDAQVREAFFAMAGTLGSNSNRASVLSAMAERPESSAETLLAVIDSAESMGSDSNKAEVLARVARRRDMDPRLEPRLRRAAKTIGSDSQYRRVMGELQATERTAN